MVQTMRGCHCSQHQVRRFRMMWLVVRTLYRKWLGWSCEQLCLFMSLLHYRSIQSYTSHSSRAAFTVHETDAHRIEFICTGSPSVAPSDVDGLGSGSFVSVSVLFNVDGCLCRCPLVSSLSLIFHYLSCQTVSGAAAPAAVSIRLRVVTVSIPTHSFFFVRVLLHYHKLLRNFHFHKL